MNLISFKHREDYGHEWYVQVIHNKRWALLQASVSWNEYTSFPFLQIKMGSGTLLSIMFWCWKIGFDIGIFEHTWNWEYMKDLDVEENELNYD
ncbi:hypothetical protein EBS02_07325 [bacterium]|nr:hypothetical protein [bacterium]